MWSIARYSLGVKQSCTSNPSTSSRVTSGTVERVEHRAAYVRHHVGVVGARGRASAAGPARRCGAPSRRFAPSGRAVRMVAQVVVGDQDDARAAVGHLAAVEATQPALDDRVDLVVVVGRRRSGTAQPRVCALGLRGALAKFSAAIARRWVVVEAVPTVVLVGDAREHVRPHELRVDSPSCPIHAAAPRCCGRRVARHGLLQFDADHQRGVGRRRTADRRSRPASRRCPTRTPPRGGTTGCPTARRARWPASLRGGPGAANSSPNALATCTTSISAASSPARGEGGVDDLGGQVRRNRGPRGSGCGEVALVATENPDVRGAAHGGRYYN